MRQNRKVQLTLTPEFAEKIKKFAIEHGYSGICELVRRVVANHLRKQGIEVFEDEIKVVQGKRNDFEEVRTSVFLGTTRRREGLRLTNSKQSIQKKWRDTDDNFPLFTLERVSPSSDLQIPETEIQHEFCF